MNILQVFRGVRFWLFAPISTHPKTDPGEVLAALERNRQDRIAQAVDRINQLFPPKKD